MLLLSFKRGTRDVISSEALTLMGIPVTYQGLTWKDFRFTNEGLKKVLTGYTSHCDEMYRDNICILLSGSNGVGKTYASSIILQYVYSCYYTARLLTFKDLISKTFNNEDVDVYYNVDFLVLDELGAEVNLKSSSEKSLLEELLKQRFSKGLPTIICTNLDLNTIKTRYGNTVFSMLSEYIKIDITGEDVRKTTLRSKSALQYLK